VIYSAGTASGLMEDSPVDAHVFAPEPFLIFFF
jgi:hypothetical protein